MDRDTFDRLTRGVGDAKTRRGMLKAAAATLLGLGLGRGAAAQVAPAGCRVSRCKKGGPGSRCNDSRSCCQGLFCNRRGVCDFKQSSGGAGDYCDNDRDCNRNFFCKKNQCIPEQCRS